MFGLFHPIRSAWNEKPLEFLTLITAAVTLVFLWLQLNDVRKTIETQNQALTSQNDLLESQAYNYIIGGLLDLDKTFIENSKYRAYFLDNRTFPADTPENEETRQKLLALADAKLDFFDSFFSQARHINWTRYTRPGWDAYFHDSFNCSAVLRQAFCRFKDEYGTDINDFAAKRWCDGTSPKPSENPAKCKFEN